jgi:hypothetical protein
MARYEAGGTIAAGVAKTAMNIDRMQWAVF